MEGQFDQMYVRQEEGDFLSFLFINSETKAAIFCNLSLFLLKEIDNVTDDFIKCDLFDTFFEIEDIKHSNLSSDYIIIKFESGIIVDTVYFDSREEWRFRVWRPNDWGYKSTLETYNSSKSMKGINIEVNNFLYSYDNDLLHLILP